MDIKQKGFTLIELVTVIILLGILSVFTLSRFSSGQTYSSVLVKNQLLASLRLTQQTALSRASANDDVVLSLTSSSDRWLFETSVGNGERFLSQVDAKAEKVYVGTDFSSSCSALPQLPVLITFDGDGNRVPSSNLRICIDADITYELCISASGYAYEGACL